MSWYKNLLKISSVIEEAKKKGHSYIDIGHHYSEKGKSYLWWYKDGKIYTQEATFEWNNYLKKYLHNNTHTKYLGNNIDVNSVPSGRFEQYSNKVSFLVPSSIRYGAKLDHIINKLYDQFGSQIKIYLFY